MLQKIVRQRLHIFGWNHASDLHGIVLNVLLRPDNPAFNKDFTRK